jgi:hypothetical protein
MAKPSSRVKNLKGRKFDRLKVLRFSHTNARGAAVWLCRCRCGNLHEAVGRNLQQGFTRSCGCLCLERLKQANTKHGHAGSRRTKEYNAWNNFLGRCTSKKHRQWDDYGGRGILVCDRWRGEQGFQNFLKDMGPCPRGCTLDRKDNNGPYAPHNCRWATRREQMLNTRVSVYLTLNGVRRHITEWAELLGWPVYVLYRRRREGWSDERCLTQPYRLAARSANVI